MEGEADVLYDFGGADDQELTVFAGQKVTAGLDKRKVTRQPRVELLCCSGYAFHLALGQCALRECALHPTPLPSGALAPAVFART